MVSSGNLTRPVAHPRGVSAANDATIPSIAALAWRYATLDIIHLLNGHLTFSLKNQQKSETARLVLPGQTYVQHI